MVSPEVADALGVYGGGSSRSVLSKPGWRVELDWVMFEPGTEERVIAGALIGDDKEIICIALASRRRKFEVEDKPSPAPAIFVATQKAADTG